MQFSSVRFNLRYFRLPMLAIAGALFAMVGETASAVTLVDPAFFGQPNTTYQEWDGFTSAAGPNPATSASNTYGTPNWFDTTAGTDGAFSIGTAPTAHIYSFSGTLNLEADIPTPTLSAGATTTLILQAELLGTPLDHSLFGVTYPGLTGSAILPTSINEVNEGSSGNPQGGNDYYYSVEWDNLPAASTFSLTYSPGDVSSSQMSARVDSLTTAAPVPEPGTMALTIAGGIGLALLGYRRRVAQRRQFA